MTAEFIQDFLTNFNDSQYPADFLNDYEPVECLAYNAQGETLLVKDRQTGCHYIAKCYRDKTLLSHTTESDLLKKLNHQGLPAFISEHQNDEMLCVVREFAKGMPLDQLARQKPLDRQETIRIGVQLCEILMYLHGQTPPVIHRDIKPQNIIVDEHGQVTLIDFGTSRTYDETASEDTHYFGTRYYAAPEQYGFSQTDCRTDVFALGVLLCWLLTGSIETQKAVKTLSNHKLSTVIKRCTAFAPQDRYNNALQVRNALTGRTLRRKILLVTGMILLALVAVLYFSNILKPLFQPNVGVVFTEPLIEEAVRLTLGKGESEEISEEDLLTVQEIFVFGDKAAANNEEYAIYCNHFANNDGTVLRGSIDTLDDIAKLKSLRGLYLGFQNINDITPLSGLTMLDNVDLRHNPIQDVSPLRHITSLQFLTIFDTNISDLTALQSCDRLMLVDAGYTPITSLAAFNGLDSLRVLVIRKSSLLSLDGIETLPLLEQIYLSESNVLDLSPLLLLSHLQEVEISENMRPAAEALGEQASFSILYP